LAFGYVLTFIIRAVLENRNDSPECPSNPCPYPNHTAHLI